MGEGDYTGGRRRTPLRLNPKAGYAVGLKLMEDRVVSAVTDFETTLLDYREHHFNFDDNPNHLSDILATVVNHDMAHSGIPRDKFFGVGIGLAGVIYAQTGVVHYSPFFGWRDVPLAALVGHASASPVYVENDVNTLTLAEQLFGAGRRHNNFVVVTVGRGIGMGMVINGQLYGGQGGAGELGHMIMERFRGSDGGAQPGRPGRRPGHSRSRERMAESKHPSDDHADEVAPWPKRRRPRPGRPAPERRMAGHWPGQRHQHPLPGAVDRQR